MRAPSGVPFGCSFEASVKGSFRCSFKDSFKGSFKGSFTGSIGFYKGSRRVQGFIGFRVARTSDLGFTARKP